jgi:mono/diheme cytochrome c family protein
MIDTLSIDHGIALHESIPPGAMLRQGTHFFYPAKVPDLRGVRHQRFLDASGLIQHRSIGDLMRYAAFTQSVDLLNRFGDFIPSLGNHPGPLPPADSVRSFVNGPFTRFTDAQAFALARYIYSLEPVPSPHEYDAETLALGEQVFIEEGCITCHPPPHYTNNELTPALGFEPPEDHYEKYPIFDISVETDPGLTLYTRRGTGYYKVPSLRGLWYRERLFHDGSLSLEQVLDPARLRDDFVPAGFRGLDSTRAVPGHPFGLELGERERTALLAYLRTL